MPSYFFFSVAVLILTMATVSDSFSSSSSSSSSFQNFSQKYLDSLSGTQTPLPEPEGYEAIAPEEYYGFTNPMANSWAGSKHEQYGGYLHNIKPRATSQQQGQQPPSNYLPK